ncbi:MAG: hypothetical protein Hyperionvirus44_7 [Hyperionvirus sp.]|uniref:Minor capsid protein P9 transmembrane helices domain-containing protein n=1 Tax=Hyperionvirus sp. TaxID=2487770 RepID=A0A3G5AHG7_9VIRU|nr:MAG: hypothetical protein Hyperionvirus44_7 [Hyperionvirus sp.]
MSNIFWLNDPSVLYSEGNYMKIIPRREMGWIEKLNVITCLCIWVVVVLVLFGVLAYVVIPLVIILVVVVLYQSSIEKVESPVNNEHMLDHKRKKKRKRVRESTEKSTEMRDKQLYMDTSDLYSLGMSERGEYEGVREIPDTVGFGNWLWQEN